MSSDCSLFSVSSVPRLCVIVPTRNDAYRIVLTLGALSSYLSRLRLPWQVIVCDQGSRDGTADLVELLEAPHVTLLRLPDTGVVADAVRQGVAACDARYVMVADAGWGDPGNLEDDAGIRWALKECLLQTLESTLETIDQF